MVYEIRLMTVPDHHTVLSSVRVSGHSGDVMEDNIKIDSREGRHLIGYAFGYWTTFLVADFNSYQDLVAEGDKADNVMARLALGNTEFEEVGRDVYAVESEFKGRQYRGFFKYIEGKNI